ncbi:hypothetical protein L226DRAFT_342863 [Lentinus tigrinus ALCF2SS1-7]|uniref:uncharacterized protein n=1 Tax=Lentinus tigrinus ALCF2SS1-7 TaxID=1328758 RepID=UPI001165E3B9|nr:hypothetical protein L226DRAFT_342863 [Lentinus tigrinus ALCF2SS1-7]
MSYLNVNGRPSSRVLHHLVHGDDVEFVGASECGAIVLRSAVDGIVASWRTQPCNLLERPPGKKDKGRVNACRCWPGG